MALIRKSTEKRTTTSQVGRAFQNYVPLITDNHLSLSHSKRMNETEVRVVAVFTLLFLGLMRWAHRCWGKAFLSTLFAPLIIVPLGGLTYLGVGILLNIFNRFLSGFDVKISIPAIGLIASIMTLAFMLWLTVLYGKDQRHLSLIVTGPGLGIVPRDSNPSLNAKCSLK